jgi:hypothetical protein
MAEPQLHSTASNSPSSGRAGSPTRSVAALDSGIPVQYELLLRKLALAEHELEAGTRVGAAVISRKLLALSLTYCTAWTSRAAVSWFRALLRYMGILATSF